jgi:hypothetical protein
MFIPDPDFFPSRIRIPDPRVKKAYRIPDPENCKTGKKEKKVEIRQLICKNN